jgi:hypothetical protein
VRLPLRLEVAGENAAAEAAVAAARDVA